MLRRRCKRGMPIITFWIHHRKSPISHLDKSRYFVSTCPYRACRKKDYRSILNWGFKGSNEIFQSLRGISDPLVRKLERLQAEKLKTKGE